MSSEYPLGWCVANQHADCPGIYYSTIEIGVADVCICDCHKRTMMEELGHDIEDLYIETYRIEYNAHPTQKHWHTVEQVKAELKQLVAEKSKARRDAARPTVNIRDNLTARELENELKFARLVASYERMLDDRDESSVSPTSGPEKLPE